MPFVLALAAAGLYPYPLWTSLWCCTRLWNAWWLGWNVLGNLLDMGQLAFAPATPEVLKLAAALDGTHRMFGKVFRWALLVHAYCVALLGRLCATAAGLCTGAAQLGAIA